MKKLRKVSELAELLSVSKAAIIKRTDNIQA